MNMHAVNRFAKASVALVLLVFSLSSASFAQGYGPYGNGNCNRGYGYNNGYNNGYGYNNSYGYNNGYNSGYAPNYAYPGNQYGYGQYGPPVVYQNRPPVIIAPAPPVVYAPAPIIVQRPRYIVPAPRIWGNAYGYRNHFGYGRRW